MGKGFFVTGTDTGIGKTIVSAAIIRALHIAGYNVCAMKPIETGCSKVGDVTMPRDGVFLKEIARMKDPVNHVTPCCLTAPAAPMVAAELENTTIDTDMILSRFRELDLKYDAVVVEGTGGLLVPVTKDYFMSDLASDIGLPVIVVAGPFLGTINHTLLTVWHAIDGGLEVAGIILNYYKPPEGTLAEETNPHLMERLSPVPIIGIMPYIRDMDTRAIDKAVSKNIDLKLLKKYL